MRVGSLWRVLTAMCLLAGGGLWTTSEALAQSGPTTERPSGEAVVIDDVLLRVDLRPDGTADWRVEYRTDLDDAATTTAFEGLAAAVDADPRPFRDRFERRMADTVAAASDATDREMSVANVSVAAETRALPRSYGVVAYEFEWRGFAAAEGDRLVVGDALGGLFLDDGEALVVSWPAGYALAGATPAPDDRRPEVREVVWNGPAEFGPDAPRIAVGPPTGPLAPVGEPLPAVAVAALVVLAGGAVLVRRGSLSLPDIGDRPGVEGDAAGGGPTDSGVTDGRTGPGPARRDAGDTGQHRSTDGGDSSGVGGEATVGDLPSDLLSNEERVLGAIRDNGGRMRQQALVERLDWTDAKTSQVVGRLREEGRIESFRIGRENVLTLPGERL
jgi:hypothetical protein